MTPVIEQLTLLRVHEGGVTALGGRYLKHGRPVADYVEAVLDELIRTGHLALGRPTPGGQQQVWVTHAGQVRYTELNSNGVREGRHGG